jgi:hypothetical protein
MDCSHISKVLDWGFDENHDFIAKTWGCVLCDAVSDKPFKDEDDIAIDHTMCDEDCFGCKAKGLQLNTGDANGRASMPKRKWEGELARYKEARRQGIQPSGTTMEKIVAAEKASENLGRAYNAEKDPNAKNIDKKTANVINEVKKAGF